MLMVFAASQAAALSCVPPMMDLFKSPLVVVGEVRTVRHVTTKDLPAPPTGFARKRVRHYAAEVRLVNALRGDHAPTTFVYDFRLDDGRVSREPASPTNCDFSEPVAPGQVLVFSLGPDVGGWRATLQHGSPLQLQKALEVDERQQKEASPRG
jgi:hypothetical protein